MIDPNIIRVVVADAGLDINCAPTNVEQAWQFVDLCLSDCMRDVAVAFEYDDGSIVGEIWNRPLFKACAASPVALRHYLSILRSAPCA
ncbi:hypothetical protein [Burkholderia ambifaria]|uniref:Uncharacterized protein n=1 Tax=Burkholderia ambifaria MEX-5 TaxID=396597 RepID=B1T3D1_9BURK|nr:hypothetical protein [Burkholderia ambifaria]EDT41901.1 hypothetical protein BamMEX5DRAFT_2297 [Burkholderia ambifaria MEX-5]